jgi:hypothetical protein
MKKLWFVAFVAACAHGSSNPKPKPPAPAEAPPGALILDGEDADQERARFAIGFVDAVADRDTASIERFTDPEGACAAIGDKAPPDCATAMRADQDEALSFYQQTVPESFDAGDTTSFAVDAAQGIYMITVAPSSGDGEKSVVVVLIEVKGRRYVVFPRKKE